MATGNEPEKQLNALHTTQDKDVFTVQWEMKLGKAQANTHLHRFTGGELCNQFTQRSFISSPQQPDGQF